ncbi:hypothetical protein B0A48_09233 [Cryoendolithus antarcticus]|uniref:Uncharacterized protein n=1 Tax=Cryoendolithus antarcticus TaxID=1507870 RepID=A0A1V8T2D8_9PEZI|nr:hypothetical protein B0A48_09233 [Cryoendolithus antarcticus]
MSKKLQRVRSAHNHNSAVVTNLRTQLAEAEDLFAMNGDDIQVLVKEIVRMRRSLDQRIERPKSEPEEPKQGVDAWLDGVEAVGREAQTTKPRSFSPFAMPLQPEPGVDEPASNNGTPAFSTCAPKSLTEEDKPSDRAYPSKPMPHNLRNTLNDEPYGYGFRGRTTSFAFGRSPDLRQMLPYLRLSGASPPCPDSHAVPAATRSTSPSPSPQPFTNFTLTTLPDSIHPSFPTVLSINNCWVSVTCSYCGANSCSQPGGGRGFLKGLVGLTIHVVQAHGPGTANSRFEGDVCLAEILEHCRLTEISERDAKQLACGSQAVERPVKRVTLDYEIARQRLKMKQAGEGVRHEDRRDHSLDDDRETTAEDAAPPGKSFSRPTRGIKTSGHCEMHGREPCGEKRKGVFCKGGVEKKLRWGENTIFKIENDDGGEVGNGVEVEHGVEMEYGGGTEYGGEFAEDE